MEYSKKNNHFSINYNYPENKNINNYRENYSRGRRFRGRKNYPLVYHNIPNHRSGYYNNYPNFPIYNKNFNNHYKQKNALYRKEKYIYKEYPYLIDINENNSDILKEINTDCKFYVIKSFSEEDIHKSIKYGVWSSSKYGNNVLSNAFNITKEKGSFVYLFFSCNGSGRYVGVSKMTSPCDFNEIFDYWTQDNKWPGLFEVEWIFIKDVPFKVFKNIIITMNDGEIKHISNARDTQEIPYEQAKNMLNIIEKYENKTDILEHFEFYDKRQANYERNMKMQNVEKDI